MPDPRRILLVDDEELNRVHLGGLLRGLGHEPVPAASGAQALELLDQDFDLLLLDALMPGMDGFEVARRVRSGAGYPDVPIIFVTTLTDREARLHAVRAGANDFISRPVDRTELKVRMDSVLALADSRREAARANAELARTVESLTRMGCDLEASVAERTAELSRTLDALQQEVREKRSAQMELQLLEEIIERSLQGIVLTDARGAILKTNPAFTEITGYSADEVLGRNPRVLKSDRHDDAFYQAMWRSLAEEGRWTGEIWNRRKNGEVYPEWLSIFAIRDKEGRATHHAGIFHDLTESKEQEARIRFQTSHDALTGLPNKALLLDRLGQELKLGCKAETGRTAVLHLDIDNFKNVNECLGPLAGDEALQAVAGRLSAMIQDQDTASKLPGDEFALLLPDVHDGKRATKIARRVLSSFARPFAIRRQEVFLSASIGIAFHPDDGLSALELLQNAETAMYRSKEAGKNRLSFYTQGLSSRVHRRISLEADLRRALRREELVAWFQPRVDAASCTVTGMEALARWKKADGTIVSPAEFIPLAEETGIIHPLGRRILNLACGQARELAKAPDSLVVSDRKSVV